MEYEIKVKWWIEEPNTDQIPHEHHDELLELSNEHVAAKLNSGYREGITGVFLTTRKGYEHYYRCSWTMAITETK